MSSVTVLTQQIELVNIVEVVQTNLSKNFTILLKRLNKHDELLIQYQKQHAQMVKTQLQKQQSFQKQLEQQQQLFTSQIQALHAKIVSLQNRDCEVIQELKTSQIGIKRLNDELFNTQIQFQEKGKLNQRYLQSVERQVQKMMLEQEKIRDELKKKQNKVQAERIIKQTEMLKDKNLHIEGQIKLATHKIQKMEILNQKAQRLQAKKDIQFMKEIEEKVKKEIRMSSNPNYNQSSSLLASSTVTPANKSFNHQLNASKNAQGLQISSQNIDSHQEIQQTKKRSSITGISGGEYLMLANMNENSNISLIIQKWGDKIKKFEIQFKQIYQNLKVLNKNTGKRQTKQNRQSTLMDTNMKDKINQIKPQLVKLWAKIDTIQDRLLFGQKKLQEKLRVVNDLALTIKENNTSKLEQKLKSLQTEIFTNIKEIKAKMETKVNQTDYQKYCSSLDDRIVQINEMIYLKSDKLQVKKALLFLQAKIKEIILVISEDQQNEKDALLTKKQFKCIACDKQVDKLTHLASSPKGNWDGLPFKDHPAQILGRFGMTNYGALSKKIKKLQSKDLPVLNKRSVNQSFQTNS